jgi:hypothetical protein
MKTTSVVIGAIAAVMFLPGCYTQFTTEEDRYHDNGEYVSSETDTSGGGEAYNYDEARDRFYDETYGPYAYWNPSCMLTMGYGAGLYTNWWYYSGRYGYDPFWYYPGYAGGGGWGGGWWYPYSPGYAHGGGAFVDGGRRNGVRNFGSVRYTGSGLRAGSSTSREYTPSGSSSPGTRTYTPTSLPPGSRYTGSRPAETSVRGSSARPATVQGKPASRGSSTRSTGQGTRKWTPPPSSSGPSSGGGTRSGGGEHATSPPRQASPPASQPSGGSSSSGGGGRSGGGGSSSGGSSRSGSRR